MTATLHPLAPLTADEIAAAIAIVRALPEFGPSTRFEIVELHEPAKEAVRAWRPGQPCPRQARVNIFESDRVGVARLVVSLDDGRLLGRTDAPGQRPMIQLEQFMVIEGIVRADPRFVEGCARRGITDMAMVCIDPWSAGTFEVEEEDGRFLAHVFAWLRLYENENFYAHPIEGLNAVVDINSGEVIRVDDHGVVPIPMIESNYEAALVRSDRSAPSRIDVVQPDGVGFRIEDGVMRWDKWSVVVGFNAREGLTLHDIRYDDRPVLYRASVAEMIVPYGSPERGHYRKHVFDVGEYGIGKLANTLTLGCDCLGAIEYLDAHMATMDGGLMSIEKAICIHEEDSGLLWKHTDFRTQRCEVRRGRKLVISTIATVGNYEYAFYWYLHLDGGIELEVKATGIINTSACIPGAPGRYASEVSPGVAAHIHQHLFCARLDMAVDGDRNNLVECNSLALPMGDGNRYGNAFYEEATPLLSERAACRRADPATMRYWKVTSAGRTNHVGQPTAYKLEPSHVINPLVHPDGASGRRARFSQNHLWATAFDPEQRFPAGEHVNHSTGDDGLPGFVAGDRSLENAEIVLWHVFGLHHPVRPEDFPVQPTISTGFKLAPAGFFDRNPTIDLPPVRNAASCCARAST